MVTKVITIERLDPIFFAPKDTKLKWVVKIDEKLPGLHIRRVHVV